MKAESRKRSFTASWSVAEEVFDRRGVRRIVAGARNVDQVFGVFFEEAPALHKRKVEYPELRVGPDTVLVGAHSDRVDGRILVSIKPNGGHRVPAVPVQRISEIELDLLVLRKDRQIEVTLAILSIRDVLAQREIV